MNTSYRILVSFALAVLMQTTFPAHSMENCAPQRSITEVEEDCIHRSRGGLGGSRKGSGFNPFNELGELAGDVMDGVAEIPGKIEEAGNEAIGAVEKAPKELEKSASEFVDFIEDIKKSSDKTADNLREETAGKINEKILEPSWEGIGHLSEQTEQELKRAMKSLAHNYCELTEGQSDHDGKHETEKEKGDGVNQDYEECMGKGITVGVRTDGNGGITPCASASGHNACYNADWRSPKHNRDKVSIELANTLAAQIQSENEEMWSLLLEESGNGLVPSLLPGLRLPKEIKQIVKKQGNQAHSGRVDTIFIKSKDILDRLAGPSPTDIAAIRAIDMEKLLVNYLALSEIEHDQLLIRNELEDVDIDWASTGLYFASVANYAANSIELALDAASGGTVGLSKNSARYVIKEGLKYANDIAKSDNPEELALHILTRKFKHTGSLVSYNIEKAQDIHRVLVSIPKLNQDTKIAKANTLKRIDNILSRASSYRVQIEQAILVKSEMDGIANPLKRRSVLHELSEIDNISLPETPRLYEHDSDPYLYFE